MRSCICERCGNTFSEDDNNPAVHYSNPAKVCWRCEISVKTSLNEKSNPTDLEFSRDMSREKMIMLENINEQISFATAMANRDIAEHGKWINNYVEYQTKLQQKFNDVMNNKK